MDAFKREDKSGDLHTNGLFEIFNNQPLLKDIIITKALKYRELIIYLKVHCFQSLKFAYS